jgi:1,4-dihydroxy-2-naphthoate octaprenyltransferase
MEKEIHGAYRLGVWFQATRPFSFTASITPVLIGAALAMRSPLPVTWILFPVFLICALLIHAATNLISDYEDFRKGVDRAYTYGSSGVLVGGLLEPKQVKNAAYALFAAAFALRTAGWGSFYLAWRGWQAVIFIRSLRWVINTGRWVTYVSLFLWG